MTRERHEAPLTIATRGVRSLEPPVEQPSLNLDVALANELSAKILPHERQAQVVEFEGSPEATGAGVYGGVHDAILADLAFRDRPIHGMT